ncbi:unnamed protein product [Polarella glacialis]|uniref:Cilia- and flagella-associated protein 157 n=1 Tax=Polarella glacialis TaxID=89957 RepID=A0A813E414_POLGL|nr:unnamed protein product [Polarella glacialis]
MAEDKSVQQMQQTGARLLQTSPGLAEKLASSSKSAGRASAAARDDKDIMISDLQRQVDAEKVKNRSLEDQYKHRVASFAKREKTTLNKIDALEKRLTDGAEHDDHSKRMEVIGNMHGSVVAGLECIQNNTAKILQDQEKDLMRAFRARLKEVSKDLEDQRSRKGEHSTELQARHRRVVAELHEAQELAQTFDKKNQALVAENQKLQERLRTRDDDRQALLRELVLARQQAARLKAQNGKEGAATGDVFPPVSNQTAPSPKGSSRSFSQKQVDQAKLQQTHNKQFEREMAFREAAKKLKRMVEAERRTVRALKQQQAELMQHRTELEVLLKQSLDDVKAEVLRHRMAAEGQTGPAMGVPSDHGPALSTVSVHELTAQDRERVLELLLSQQRVVQLLYSKTFAHPQLPPISPEPVEMRNEPDFTWLGDILPPEDFA